MTDDIKYLDITEFTEFGYLQEVNRLFFHPLGLAMEVEVDEDGHEVITGIWDCRDSEDGVVFAPDAIDREKVERVAAEQAARRLARVGSRGYWTQRVE